MHVWVVAAVVKDHLGMVAAKGGAFQKGHASAVVATYPESIPFYGCLKVLHHLCMIELVLHNDCGQDIYFNDFGGCHVRVKQDVLASQIILGKNCLLAQVVQNNVLPSNSIVKEKFVPLQTATRKECSKRVER